MSSSLKINERIESVIPGIEYKVTTTSGKEFYMCFLHKTTNGELHDGVTNEDLAAILIDRLEKQNNKKSDRFNNKAIFHLREAQRHLEDRGFFFRNYKRKRDIIKNKEQ